MNLRCLHTYIFDIFLQFKIQKTSGFNSTLFVSAEDVKQGKPSPEGYLLAAEKLGVSIQDCVVFEDAEAGVLAAQRANAQIVIVGSLEKGFVAVKNYTGLECIGG
ncbi:HAD-IA family hydrolase [Acinetobacter johnsonii]|uniref:HAD-IA family hydrolase n=1 Tax=Acinetobacter johnsonii TaxID=40214 RepID=UPI003AF4A779